jgi:hypothetical protein
MSVNANLSPQRRRSSVICPRRYLGPARFAAGRPLIAKPRSRAYPTPERLVLGCESRASSLPASVAVVILSEGSVDRQREPGRSFRPLKRSGETRTR